MYVIADENGAIVNLTNVPLFGEKVTLMACFHDEDDALKILYQLQTGLGLQGHHVHSLGASFMVETLDEG